MKILLPLLNSVFMDFWVPPLGIFIILIISVPLITYAIKMGLGCYDDDDKDDKGK
jgi:hypothetical protein